MAPSGGKLARCPPERLPPKSAPSVAYVVTTWSGGGRQAGTESLRLHPGGAAGASRHHFAPTAARLGGGAKQPGHGAAPLSSPPWQAGHSRRAQAGGQLWAHQVKVGGQAHGITDALLPCTRGRTWGGAGKAHASVGQAAQVRRQGRTWRRGLLLGPSWRASTGGHMALADGSASQVP